MPPIKDICIIGGELEEAIMRAVWGFDRPVFAPEVHECLERRRAYTTVTTVFGILVDKGLLTKEKHKGVWRYAATMSEAEYLASVMVATLRALDDKKPPEYVFTQLLGQLDPRERWALISVIRRFGSEAQRPQA